MKNKNRYRKFVNKKAGGSQADAVNNVTTSKKIITKHNIERN